MEDENVAPALNRLCREQMKRRIYADILADMTVCEIEGWDKLEYIRELQGILNDLASHERTAKG